FDTYFYREYGRSLKGQLRRGKVSGRRYQRISLVAGLTNGELIAPMTYEEMMTSDFFEPQLFTPNLKTIQNPCLSLDPGWFLFSPNGCFLLDKKEFPLY
ncbi:hypothetical protein PTT32_11580, partial [Streptococcus pneumoniae]|nr:hypothetical protein [Streptococcus pneumoniae]